MKKNVAFRIQGKVCVSVHSATDPSDSEWGSYIESMRRAATAVRGDLMQLDHLVFTDGGGPWIANDTAPEGSETLGRIALVTHRADLRAGLSLLSSFSLTFGVFSPQEIAKALDLLEVSQSLSPKIWHFVDELAAEVGQPLSSVAMALATRSGRGWCRMPARRTVE